MSVAGPGRDLLVGPLLRYVGTTTATVWVETDAPRRGDDSRASSDERFNVEGHHYALVLIEDLEPGTVTPYDVRLDGRRVWPPDDGRPAPGDPHARRRATGTARLRLLPRRGPRAAAVLAVAGRASAEGLGVDALWAYSQTAPAEARRSGRTGSCCSEIRSTPTSFRRRRQHSSALAGTYASLRAKKSRTSRSTPGSIASRGRTPISAGCCRRCRRP